MNSSPHVPNLYECYKLDRTDECSSLGVLLAGKDARLESQGYGSTDTRRVELQMAFAVLSSPTKRGLYDKALASGRTVTWGELDYLANFGDWPDPLLLKGVNQQSPHPPQPQPKVQYPPQPQPHVQQPQQFAQPQPQQEQPQQGQRGQSPYGKPQTQYQPNSAPYAQPFNPFQQQGYQHNVPAHYSQNNAVSERAYSAYAGGPAMRATAGERVLMTIVDSFFLALLAGTATIFTVWSDVLLVLVPFLVIVLYLVGLESKTGGSLGKKMLGYEVRNRKTGEYLTPVESAKRQWFKLIGIVPAVGQIASFVGNVWGFATITEKNSYLAVHDDIVDAEVVKKKQH